MDPLNFFGAENPPIRYLRPLTPASNEPDPLSPSQNHQKPQKATQAHYEDSALPLAVLRPHDHLEATRQHAQNLLDNLFDLHERSDYEHLRGAQLKTCQREIAHLKQYLEVLGELLPTFMNTVERKRMMLSLQKRLEAEEQEEALDEDKEQENARRVMLRLYNMKEARHTVPG